MGALHGGHARLMRVARDRAGDGLVVVSIFVNPLQFAPGEDLDHYPRSLDADLELCRRHGVDVVFAPSSDEVYPGGEPLVGIDPGPLGAILEGAARPGHFRGVLTVVAKLFGLVRPDVGVFGQKDFQQLVLIRRMCEDLCLGVDVVGSETVREPDGLALSSRNAYLSPEERLRATSLSRALYAGRDAAANGLQAAERAAREVLDGADVELDYLAVRDPDLGELDGSTEGVAARMLVAARVGTTRLIDNLPLTLGAAAAPGTAGGADGAVNGSGIPSLRPEVQ
ncbi:MAG: pantoate--beta-alanine ligase [Nocardioidaceae bacterium]|nr:pantoate--beta-alanine ligase [Nocardioidaceae bacterium]